MLEEALANIQPIADPNVLVGFEKADDAGVYRLSEDLAVVQTVDFFTPVVDDPFVYGKIAAANALSDIYAMGAKPLFALSVVGFPSGTLENSILTEILQGGTSKMNEAQVPVIGGHSVQDQELKFGYCVTGSIRPAEVLTNAGARPGDALFLTKPLGTGIITTGIKFGKASPDVAAAAISVMEELNATAASVLSRVSVHAVTDVTGFGFVGHAFEMARASQVTFQLNAAAVPILKGTSALAGKGMLPKGIQTNERYVGTTVNWGGVGQAERQILLDPQTSGGLLVSVAADAKLELIQKWQSLGVRASEVGRVTELEGGTYLRFQ